MKFKYILSLLIITNFAAVAQQVIEFRPLSGQTTGNYTLLTKEDVDETLANEWDGGEFIAYIHPEVDLIDFLAFYDNKYLVEVNAPNLKSISGFQNCASLTTINCPLLWSISLYSFYNCNALTSVTIGTGFTEPTEVYLEIGAFYDSVLETDITKNIDLFLGPYVTPAPDLEKITWNYTGLFSTSLEEYTWKSITVVDGIKPTTINNLKVCPNIVSDNVTITLNLETAGNLNITLNNVLGQELFELYNNFVDVGTFIKTFSIETLPQNTYYIKVIHNGNVKVEKIIKK